MVLGKTLQPFSPAPGSLFLLYLLFLGASSFRSRVCLVLFFFLFPIYFLIIFFQGTREIRNDPAPWEKKKPLRFTSTLRAVLKCLGLLMLEDWGDFSLFLSRPHPPRVCGIVCFLQRVSAFSIPPTPFTLSHSASTRG